MSHTKKPAVNFILLTAFVIIIVSILIGGWLLSIPTDRPAMYKYIYRGMENALRNYKSAALMHHIDNGKWPPAGEYLPDSPMVISLDHYTDKSFDRINYTHLLIKEIPAGSKRFYLGLRPGERSPLSPISIQSYDHFVFRNRLDGLFRADGLPYSGEIIGSGDIFIPMR